MILVDAGVFILVSVLLFCMMDPLVSVFRR